MDLHYRTIQVASTVAELLLTNVDSASWYRSLRGNRVTLLRGVSAWEVSSHLDPLPPDAPAFITVHIVDVRSQSQVVAYVLENLEIAARHLFPAWLPGAEYLDGPNRLDLLSARKFALDLAAQSDHFGPFISSMAESALLDSPMAQRFIERTRAEGLRRLIADTFGRETVTVLIDVDCALTPEQHTQLIGASEWLAQQGGFEIWLAGLDNVTSDRVRAVGVSLHPPRRDEPAEDDQRVRIPAIAGQPHPGSEAEKKLERALVRCAWASGREWNQPFQPTPLHERMVVDLRWPSDKCVVEIDGDEHRQKIKFARDRARDVMLQVHGYAVLRFTNAQILDDVAAVVSAIESFIKNKRGSMSRDAYIEGIPGGE